MNTKKGITPVIAIVLLLMMTVGAVGGAYVWFSDIIDQAQNTADQQRNTELNVYNAQCSNMSGTFVAEFWVENTGDRQVDFSVTDVLIYDQFTGDRVVGLGEREMDLTDMSTSQRPSAFDSSDHDDAPTDPGQVSGYNLSMGTDFDAGQYEIRLRFSNNDVTASTECQLD